MRSMILGMHAAHIMDKVTSPDPYSDGVVTKWHEGAPIRVTFHKISSTEARIAEANGMKSQWTILHSDLLQFEQNDRIKRDDTGEIYRIKGDSRYMTAPPTSEIRQCIVEAEVITR